MTQILPFNKLSARAACAMLAAVFCCALLAADASAQSYVVDSSSDAATPNACTGAANDCTLRGAIGLVNSDVAPDDISFSGVSTITIGSPLVPITNTLTIDGAGATKIVGSGGYSCAGGNFAIDATTAQVQILGLAIHDVCGRAIKSALSAPTIQVGPRRADNSVPINGAAAGAGVEIFRADTSGEALSLFTNAGAPVPVAGGTYSYVPPAPLAPSDKFTAATTGGGITSTFSGVAAVPSDLTSPTLTRAVAIANNAVRLDFDEQVGGALHGVTGAFTLSMAGVNRQITSVDISGNSVFLGSATTPWATGEAGTVGFTGSGRVTDVAGNELIGQPTAPVLAGPGELSGPVISRFRTSPSKFCRRVTSKCNKRKQGYIYLSLNKPSRVAFTVYRAKKRSFVVKFVRKLDAGSTRLRLFPTMNGRTMPATSLYVEAVAEDSARNFSAPVRAPFKVVTRNKLL